MATPSNAFLESFKTDLPSHTSNFQSSCAFSPAKPPPLLPFSRSWKHKQTHFSCWERHLYKSLCQGQLMGSFIFCLSGKLGHPPPCDALGHQCQISSLREKKRKRKKTLCGWTKSPCLWLSIFIVMYLLGLSITQHRPHSYSPQYIQSPQLDRIHTYVPPPLLLLAFSCCYPRKKSKIQPILIGLNIPLSAPTVQGKDNYPKRLFLLGIYYVHTS